MDDHNELGEALNQYGEVATHDDCGDHDKAGCSGWLGFWENPHTGNKRLLCAEHMDQADRRQNAIHREYLNDGVYSPEY